MTNYIDLADAIFDDTPIAAFEPLREALTWLDEHPDQVPGRTTTEPSDRYVFDGATVLAVEFSRSVEDDDGYIHPHPEFPDRHSITAMLKEGDQLPTVGAKDRITVIIDKADPEPTNAEKLEPAVRQIMADVRLNGPHSETSVYWAGRLDAAGVKAPGDETNE